MSAIFFLMGKSTSGKDSLSKMLEESKEFSLHPVILYTTRPMRDGEQEGREYHFCSESELEGFRKEGRVVEERVYHTVHGDWYYFTLADESMEKDLKNGQNYLAIGTLEAYNAYKKYFGEDLVIPLYISVDDDIRLIRSIERERMRSKPDYKEMCRRFIADSEDFSDEKLAAAGVTKTLYNNAGIEECLEEIEEYMRATTQGRPYDV